MSFWMTARALGAHEHLPEPKECCNNPIKSKQKKSQECIKTEENKELDADSSKELGRGKMEGKYG